MGNWWGWEWQTESWYSHGCYRAQKVFTPADFSLQSRILSHCTVTTSELKCFLFRLHRSTMIFYLKQDNLRLWNFSFLLLWRYCDIKHIFNFSLHCLFFISLHENFRKSSFISQQNLSYILQQRMCLLFDNILFVAMHYLTAVGMGTKNQNVYSNGQNISGVILLFFLLVSTLSTVCIFLASI